MGNLIKLNPRPTRNLYMVNDYYVVLALSPEDAISCILDREESDKTIVAKLIDDQREVNVIKSGIVEVILWEREPKPLERLSFKIKVRDFIDQDLKRYTPPWPIDILEDRGAIRPKK